MLAACRFAAAIALLFCSFSASAQGWFAGGSIGQAQQDDYTVSGPVTAIDNADTSYRIFGGYLISPIQGIVASYIDLGQAYYAGPALGGFTEKLSADGFDISYIIGWAPGTQERITVFGTVGVFAWDQDVRYTELGGLTFLKHKDDGSSFSFGIGAEFNLDSAGTNAWAVHVEWQTFKKIGNEDIPSVHSFDELDRQVFSVGASYRFGRD